MKLFQKLTNMIIQTRAKIRSFRDYLLGNTYDHFLCAYPENSGYFIKKLIRRLVNKLNFDKHNIEKIQNIDPENIIVYASKNKRMLDFLYYHTKLKSLNLPYPQIGFDFNFFLLLPVKRLAQIFICHADYFLHHFHFKNTNKYDYVIRELLNGKTGFLCLIEEVAFYKRFVKSAPDPLYLLIELQSQIDKSIIIIPEGIIYVSKPMRSDSSLIDILFGTHEKPGLIKRLLNVIRHPEKIRVELATPIDLREFLNRPQIKQLASEFQAHKLRSHIVDILNRQRKSITGPILKSRQEITEDILTQKSLREYLAQYAQENNISLSKTHKKAAGYIKEIAANYNLQVINIIKTALAWAFKNIFEDLVLNQDEINRMREKSIDAPLVLVPCHKSHLDYLLLPYVMFINNMPAPHIAAGKNLSFWPLGPIFRRGGAFFLRRTFQGAPLYAKIFAAYLEKLLHEGFNIKIFIEGGRSRSGKLLAPKPGGIAMMINAYLSGACKNLHFVPVYIGYDRVLEEDAYLKEIEGGKKNPENLKGLIGARKFLKKKYGKVYMHFDEPISLIDYIQLNDVDLSKLTRKEYMKFVKKFGYKLINAINARTVATPHGIIASAVLTCSKNSFSKLQITERVSTYMNLLTFSNAELSDTLLINPDATLNSVITRFIQRNFIELADEDEGEITDNTLFIVKSNKRAILDYYKNSVIFFFSNFAYTAMAILEIDRFQFSSSDLAVRYKFLEKIFMDEFFYDEETTSEEEISRCLKGFINEGILVPDTQNADTYHITSAGLRKLKWFARFLHPFLESYKTALLYFEKYPADKYEGKERIKKIQAKGQKLYKAKVITLKESLSQITYTNAVNFYTKNGVSGSEDHIKIEYYKNIIDRLILLLSS
ncbi:MAG: 1-acyl-sn-glycerol-3-phosphate acyltransferase [Proteobacteria bacterium]|nr:1-acyl-sn-glycerol-3-phosphate acyltransferase [Pseudomonadota bacterium]MBU1389168.1 1-acyl-sn-glycerol-3-phosphate acyltransferase [Pseudomonadota bacterium]MBU1543392.1 1-acyl-sn-glycerol-3-phosphate acyltransferase [Pseudomonadota bacterium]MBU2482913.1 1-acyl-sn-glycerol-3-phosphate acyltransferase [Pseudomonadota bacterium]